MIAILTSVRRHTSCGMRHRMFTHIAWTTRDRAPVIDRELAEFLAELLPRIAGEERAELLALGIVKTHVHALVRINPKTDIPRLLQRFKGSSAFIVKKERGKLLQWATGYNLESVGALSLTKAWSYVAHQHLHHKDDAIEGWPAVTPDLSAVSTIVADYLQRLDSLR